MVDYNRRFHNPEITKGRFPPQIKALFFTARDTSLLCHVVFRGCQCLAIEKTHKTALKLETYSTIFPVHGPMKLRNLSKSGCNFGKTELGRFLASFGLDHLPK